MQKVHRIPNKLINEKSPYLLQHAYNPVTWYPWGDAAFEEAKKEDKPIFLSIGYSTCHWCHVMADESFEDNEVAQLLNRDYISIKVDKEERPDIDSVYMQVCQTVTGQGGWPLTIMMNSKGEPFFAATYIPKHNRYGMYGLIDLLQAVTDKWKNHREELETSGKEIKGYLNQRQQETKQGMGDEEILEKARLIYTRTFDETYGGFGNEPKFPAPHNLMFLLRYAHLAEDEEALRMVETTLKHMYQGGIYDHIGYGFSRYSTDNRWLVPHFEKMLYDNALLAIIYSEMYQKTKRSFYKNIVEEILLYIERELTDPEGGFYCAQDADSEGVEGKYYVFTPEEIQSVLGEREGEAFQRYYDITESGNFEGKSIPNLIHNGDVFDHFEEKNRFQSAKEKLYQYRLDRTRLHKDDKIITSWNALMIIAYAKAYQTMGDEKYLNSAAKAITFLEKHLANENKLKLSFRKGTAYGEGHIDDYAFYIWALIEMYQGTFQIRYLEMALNYHKKMMELFYDEEEGGFYLYSKDAEQLIARPKEVYDGAIPSGNSVAAYVMFLLARLTGDSKLEEEAEQQLSYMRGAMGEYPTGHSFGLLSLLLEVYGTKELVCVVEDEAVIDKVCKELSTIYSPSLIRLMKVKGQEESLTSIVPFTKDYQITEGQKTFYLCQNHSCQSPVRDLALIKDQLKR